MRIIVALAAFINGAYMLFDGFYVSLHNKYFGASKPGPWSVPFTHFNIDVLKLGPMFIAYGIAWLLFVLLFWFKPKASYRFGLTLSILTLWYLPFGTVLSLVIFVVLFGQLREPGV